MPQKKQYLQKIASSELHLQSMAVTEPTTGTDTTKTKTRALDAERILISGECINDGYWFIEHAIERAKTRVVFDRRLPEVQTEHLQAV
jgi:alkylation response protein AidB-like acyl-CoA dehydrogenase